MTSAVPRRQGNLNCKYQVENEHEGDNPEATKANEGQLGKNSCCMLASSMLVGGLSSHI